MKSLLLIFWNICLLRAGPQHLPVSPFLGRLSLSCYFLVGVITSLNTLPVVASLLPAAADTLLLTVFAYLLLWIRGLTARYTRVLTALAGSGSLLGLIGLPIVSWWQQLMADVNTGAAATSDGVLLASWIFVWAWLFWNLVVIGQIFRNALSTIYIIGASVALLYMYVSLNVSRVIYALVAG
jgi:hypothetical protein